MTNKTEIIENTEQTEITKLIDNTVRPGNTKNTQVSNLREAKVP